MRPSTWRQVCRRLFGLAALVAIVPVAAAGCGVFDHGSDPTSAPPSPPPSTVAPAVQLPSISATDQGARHVRLPIGGTAEVELTPDTPSVGDNWYVSVAGDGNVSLTKNEDTTCDKPGCDYQLIYRITADRAGTSRVTFQYCFRTPNTPDCPARPGAGSLSHQPPVVLTVAVGDQTPGPTRSTATASASPS